MTASALGFAELARTLRGNWEVSISPEWSRYHSSEGMSVEIAEFWDIVWLCFESRVH